MTPETPPVALRQKDFAAHIGCKPGYITKLKQDGRLVMRDDGLVLVAESIARIEATRDPAKRAVAARHAAERGAALAVDEAPAAPAAPDQQAERVGNTYQAARAIKEKYLAMSARRDYEISMGKLLEADQVRAAVFSAGATLRTRLEALPEVLGPQIIAIKDERQAINLMAETIEHALEDIAREFSAIGAPRE